MEAQTNKTMYTTPLKYMLFNKRVKAAYREGSEIIKLIYMCKHFFDICDAAYSIMVKNTNSGARLLGFKSQPCYLLVG